MKNTTKKNQWKENEKCGNKKQTKKVKREGRKEGRRGEKGGKTGGNRRRRLEKFEKGRRRKEGRNLTCFIHFKLQIISFLDFPSQFSTRFFFHMFLLKLETPWQ